MFWNCFSNHDSLIDSQQKNEFHHLEELEGKKMTGCSLVPRRGSTTWHSTMRMVRQNHVLFFTQFNLKSEKKRNPNIVLLLVIETLWKFKGTTPSLFSPKQSIFWSGPISKKYVVYVFHKWGISLFNWKMFSSQFQIWLKIMIFNNSTLNFKKKDFIMKRLPNKFIYNLWIFFPHSYLKKMF